MGSPGAIGSIKNTGEMPVNFFSDYQ